MNTYIFIQNIYFNIDNKGLIIKKYVIINH